MNTIKNDDAKVRQNKFFKSLRFINVAPYKFFIISLISFMIIFNYFIYFNTQNYLYAEETKNTVNNNDKNNLNNKNNDCNCNNTNNVLKNNGYNNNDDDFGSNGSGGNGYNNNDNDDIFNVPFIVPLNGNIDLKFRQDYFDINKKITRKHTGIDISGKFNQEVLASGNGMVVYIGFSPIGGRTIVIKHNEKIRTTYLNLLSIFVSEGDYVHQGDVIAAIGAEDDPSSFQDYHLHFGVIYDSFYLDPLDVLKISYKSISKYISLEYFENDFYLK
ncbi:MAG: M23 family metallopeptidase [Actinobacteria bacterium]|nr:M23 family metallopeptidase [Cyanobacteriota bacterium]MCL5770955.1 M23 family metallopeptidase [Actinomycetota bacterium]